MALFMKQDFTPPLLSKKWVAIKFRPNVLLYNRKHIISILESGLLFREDSIEVEQESPTPEDTWNLAGGGKSGWLTRGERMLSVLGVALSVYLFPPRGLRRSLVFNVSAYVSTVLAVRVCHRSMCDRGSLRLLLTRMREYLALARRAAACLKEQAALQSQLNSVSSAIDSTHTLLCRQQSALCVLMSRASSALLGNAPWLNDDVAWSAISEKEDNLQKIHHAFLVVQSTLLKHIAMAHFVPPKHAQKIYKNHNERIYWIHTVLIEHISKEFKDNYEALDRMYRLLKNYGTKDANISKKLGSAISDVWFYSDVHNDIARASLELKVAFDNCTNLDMFLDSCSLNKEELNLSVLNKDIDMLIDNITNCLTTVQSSQLRLRKLQRKFGVDEVKNEVNDKIEVAQETLDTNVVMIDNFEPLPKDEVYFFIKTTDDEDNLSLAPVDVTTGPGKKEKENTEVVLKELRRKLVKREDLMRERERQALVKSMPELKGVAPEFPRQMNMLEIDRKGYINKINKRTAKHRLFRKYKISKHRRKNIYKLEYIKFDDDIRIANMIFEANTKLKSNNILLIITKAKNKFIIKVLFKNESKLNLSNDFDSTISDGISDVESNAINDAINEAYNDVFSNQNGYENVLKEINNVKFDKVTRKDLELSPSSSESDFENNRRDILNDMRRYRAVRKKNYPSKQCSVQDKDIDESLKPVEYNFGTGMAIASVLQINRNARFPLGQEEVFIGDGEVSGDSGNDDT